MPDRILTEISDYTVTVSIHTDSGISTLDLEPTDVYKFAQHLEWLTEFTVDTHRRDRPSFTVPAGVAIWGETAPSELNPTLVHIALVGDDDDLDFGRSIILAPDTAATLATTLIAKAVLVAEPFDNDSEPPPWNEESEDV